MWFWHTSIKRNFIIHAIESKHINLKKRTYSKLKVALIESFIGNIKCSSRLPPVNNKIIFSNLSTIINRILQYLITAILTGATHVTIFIIVNKNNTQIDNKTIIIDNTLMHIKFRNARIIHRVYKLYLENRHRPPLHAEK